MFRRLIAYFRRRRARFGLQRDRSGFVGTVPDARGRFELAPPTEAFAFKARHRDALRGGWRVVPLKAGL